MTRRSFPRAHLISQQSTVNPSVTLFKLENPDGDLEPAPFTPLRRSKRVKVDEEVVKVEEVVNKFPVSVTRPSRQRRTRGRMQDQVKPFNHRTLPHLHGSPRLSSRLWTSHILLLRVDARHMILSKKCAHGFLWIRLL